MKTRKFELVSLEDRNAPAALIGYAPAIEPARAVAAEVAPATSALTVATTAVAPNGRSLDKLSANHNQTLVRDRQGRKRRRK